MFDFNTRIWLYGTLVEVNVEYEINDNIVEIEKANVIGVYHRGDNPTTQDYSQLGTDLPLWPSEMSKSLYDELVQRAEIDLWEMSREQI